MSNLTDQEKKALKKEKRSSFFEQPKALRITVVALSCSAMLHGWIQSSSNGANPTLIKTFNLGAWNSDGGYWEWTDGWRSVMILAGINAIPYFAGSFFGQ